MNHKTVEHSLLKSVTLHLLPGILGGIGYFVLVPFVRLNGFPSLMALSLSGIFVIIPFELGFLLYQQRKTGEKLFNGVIRYTKPLKIGQYFIWIFTILLFSGLAFKAFNFTTELIRPLFTWIPSLDMGLSNEYSKSKLMITYGIFMFSIVLVLSTIEELYFRGYLLPRMPSTLKGATEITHSALFALYNTWNPWLFITRTIGGLPLVYIVKRKENINIGIISHCLLNSIDLIIALIFIMKM
ncbi:MAG TPA: CPBP family intramembrane metalloprotease [Prolixibacteraceae bacterium]|nr:CPBP family intramembrane metalloprotease [Prolixibacteraceae bacterium]